MNSKGTTMKILAALVVSTALIPASAMAQSGTLEGIHHWVSEGEAKALGVILEGLRARGFEWQDSAVGGLTGANATQALRTRLAAGNPPGTMQFVGFEGVNWAAEGVLRDLSPEADAGGWRDVLAPQLLPFVSSEEAGFFAVPINMHRNDWVWANKKVFDDNGITVPTTWAELIASGEKLKAAGIVPLATGDEPWQIGTIFDALLLDLNGADFYRRAAIDLDEAALSSPEMIATFDTLRQVRGLVDDNFTGRDWAVATGMVINGEAAMQIMGDWAKGEFLLKGLEPNVDFLCFATPSETPDYIFNVDAFGLFNSSDAGVQAAQVAFAETIMDPQVQHDFNAIKGSIPARSDVTVDDLDACAIKSYEDRAAAVEADTMVGSLTQGFAAQPEFATIFTDVAARFFTTEMSSEEAVQALVDGIANAR